MSKLDQNTWIVSLANVGKENASTPPTPPTPDPPDPPDPEPLPEFPDGYTIEDAHIFVANGATVRFPCPVMPTFVAVNENEVTPVLTTGPHSPGSKLPFDWLDEDGQYYSVPAEEGDKIYAIFDWENGDDGFKEQDWFSDILQFGLNSETGQRNQLKGGFVSFWRMVANPEAIIALDITNLDLIDGSFMEATNFNQDISGWDTSNIDDGMDNLFYYAETFNQDLSGWCVTLVPEEPIYFAEGATSYVLPQPVWGTCP